MKQWQIDAIKAVNIATEEFIAHINKMADTYVDDIVSGELGYKGIEPEKITEWFWESA